MSSVRNARLPVAIAISLLAAQTAHPQRHELGLTLGRITGTSRGNSVDLGAGVAFQANYGFRFISISKAALFGEVHFLANPLRDISSADARATRDVATLYVVPGVRVKFRPAARIAPYAAIGAGYALYEQSLFQIDGRDNPAPRFTHRGVLGFGGGVDFKVWRFIDSRLEVRDFYSGNPGFNVPLGHGGQHNVVAGGGFVLRFGGEK